jgi:AcrR family transcriptional regulator
VADICRESGCSVGSLYHHFGNKEGVAGELFIHAIDLLNQDLLARLLRCRSVASGVRMVVTQYSDWVSAHPDYARFLHSGEVEFTPAAKTRLREIYRTHITEVFLWFQPYVAAGQMRALPPETYVPLISGPIRDYTRQWLSGRVQKAPAAVKVVFADAAWNAVRQA